MGGVPVQVPGSAVSVPPAGGVPAIVGGAVFAGGSVATVTTSSGPSEPASRELKKTPSVDCGPRVNAYVPSAVRTDVTSYSTQVFVAMAPLSSIAPLVRAGFVFQVRSVSVQALSVV